MREPSRQLCWLRSRHLCLEVAMRSGPAVEEHESYHRRAAIEMPRLLTVDETADLLRTTKRAIYAMIARRQLPGIVRIRRRVLVRADDLLDWLRQKRAPSPEE